MDGRKNAFHRAKVNPVDFNPPKPLHVSATGIEFKRKPGRKKKLSAEGAAVIFDLQVQIRAAKRTIIRILAEHGVLAKHSRIHVLAQNWADRGDISVIHPGPPKKAKR